MNNDLISREALKNALNYIYDCAYIDSKSKEGIASDIIDEIDNAPTVEVRDGYDFGYTKGLEDGKKQAQTEAIEYEYIAVRSYTDGCNTSMTKLSTALAKGYEFVRASEVVKNSKDYSDYIEYILRRRKQNG